MPEESDGGTHVFTVAVIGVLVAALAPGVIVVVVVAPVVIHPVVIIVTLLVIRVRVLLVVVLVIASVELRLPFRFEPLELRDGQAALLDLLLDFLHLRRPPGLLGGQLLIVHVSHVA